MFARFSAQFAPRCDDEGLSSMAQAMGCGLIVEESRSTHPAFVVQGGVTALAERRPLTPAPRRP
jgi:hypothetical protein